MHQLFEAFNRLRLPGPSVLPAAGAVVGLYSGLAAGLFANLIALVSGIVFGLSRVAGGGKAIAHPGTALWDALMNARWHGEYALIGAPVALIGLWVAKVIEPGGPRDEVKRRLRVLALLVLGALALYYPLVALAAVNTVFGHPTDMAEALKLIPWWLKLLAPAAGGFAVGMLLRKHPETHGHGVPEVVLAVKRARDGLPAEGGVLKLFASAITIGSGGSAGREGPIVFGGAAFASAVGRTLGFTRKELSILLACGAGAGISASFNAPIAGAVFAMEIILREFELKVFSPIILASVTATMVGRGVMGGAPMIKRLGYTMVSGWEIVAYVGLGLVCGIVAFAFVRMLHGTEAFFGGGFQNRISLWLGSKALPIRAAIGGLMVGLLALANPTVWGSGHEFVNLAAVGHVGFWFMLVACVFKLLGTTLTIGSGGSGGTFFPAAVIGAMAGGAFGALVHHFIPSLTAPAGAYSMVGMGGGVAGLTRGPLTGMMMMYELTGNYAIILPLMVTCTISSALCHTLVERGAPKVLSDADLLSSTLVRQLALEMQPVKSDLKLRPLVDQLLTAEDGTLTVADAAGRPYGIVHAEMLRDVWRDESLHGVLVAIDLARKVDAISADADLQTALARMDQEEIDALPVVDTQKNIAPYGVITRAAIRRFLFNVHARAHQRASVAVAATELGA